MSTNLQNWFSLTFRWLLADISLLFADSPAWFFFQAKPKDSVYKIQLRDIFNFPHVLSDDLISITVFSTFSSRRISRVIHERFPYIEGTSFYSIHSPIWYVSKIWTVKAQLEKKIFDIVNSRNSKTVRTDFFLNFIFYLNRKNHYLKLKAKSSIKISTRAVKSLGKHHFLLVR